MFCSIIKQLLIIPSRNRLFHSTVKVFALANNDCMVDEDGIPIDYKEIKLVLYSRRLDTLISKATGNTSA